MSKSVAERLNPYLSDLVVSFVKLHDLHWNVKGKMFVQVHGYTESRYDVMAEQFDAVAEKIIMKGEKPVSCLKDYMALASVKELNKGEYSDAEALQEVLADTELLLKEAVELRQSFADEDDFTVVMMLEEHIAAYEKEIWFLKSIMA